MDYRGAAAPKKNGCLFFRKLFLFLTLLGKCTFFVLYSVMQSDRNSFGGDSSLIALTWHTGKETIFFTKYMTSKCILDYKSTSLTKDGVN